MTTVLDKPSRHGQADPSVARTVAPVWLVTAAATVIAAGLFLRFFDRSYLWLDEALTVNIARLPISHLVGALRHDGAPPLYYALLHVWIRLFGSGDVTVRALSGIFAVAALPVVWLAGRRMGGARVGWIAVVLLSVSPFATHYATEARMYSLAALLAALGVLAVLRALERATLPRLAAVAVVTALLLYTHYWSLYLVAVTGALLVWRGWGKGSAEARRVVGALVVGCLAFVPWLPVFAYQAKHTGTPWASPSQPWWVFPGVLGEFAGAAAPESPTNFMVLFVLLCLGFKYRPTARWLATVVVGTVGLAILAGYVSRATYAPRYTAVVFPLFVLWAAAGASVVATERGLLAVLAIACVLGLGAGIAGATTEKSQAGQVSRVINAAARPEDVVVYCPDQLGPAMSRYVKAPVAQYTFPAAQAPQRVDWVDYRERVRAASPADFAAAMSARAGNHDVWLVWSQGYSGLDKSCDWIEQDLDLLRPGAVDLIQQSTTAFEREALVRYPASIP